MRRAWRFAPVAAVVAVALGWWFLAPTGRRAAQDSDGGSPSRADTPPGLAPRPHRTASVPDRAEATAGPRGESRLGEGRIEGTVRREGKPAAARVELRRGQSAATMLLERAEGAQVAVEEARAAALKVADAAEDGRFAFSDVAPGEYLVRAEATDGAVGRARAWIGARGARDVADVVLEAAGTTLRGRVLHTDGSPWSGDVLVLGEVAGARFPDVCVGTARTDPEGRFVVSGLPAVWVVVLAVAPDSGHGVGEPVELPSAAEHVIVWEAGRTPVAGRVVSATNRAPIGGAEVDGWSLRNFGLKDRARTGDDGRFRVLVPSQGGSVSVRAEGFAPAESEVEDPKRELEIVLQVLQRAARIRGVVTRRGDGGPVAGAEVTTLVNVGRDQRASGLPLRTDDQGRFLAEDLRAGSCSLFVRGAGRVSAAFLPGESAARAAATVTLEPGDDVEVAIETVPAARVVGTVADADGAPIEGAIVLASRRIEGRSSEADPPPWEAYGFDRVATGRDGRFEFASLVPDVEYELSASAPGLPGSPIRRVRAAGGASATVDLVLPSGRWGEVTVLEAGTDAPVAGVRVCAATHADPRGDDDSGGSSQSDAEGVTDEQGRTRLGPLGPGPILFTAEAEGYAQSNLMKRLEVVEGPHGPTATVRLERARRISGRVLRPDGEPAAGATVWLTTATGPGKASGTSVVAGQDGTFVFESLGEGDRTVRATLETEGLASQTLPAPVGAVGLTLRLAARSVVARVLDADGNPVPSARGFYSYSLPGGGWSGPNDRVKNGRLVIEIDDANSATTGTLTVDEAADGDGRRLPLGEARIEGVRPGQEVVVRLPRERTIEGLVLGPDGKGVAGARVLAERVGDDPGQVAAMEAPWVWSVSPFVRTDATGAFRVGQLNDGPHFVAVLPSPAYAPPPTARREAGEAGVEFRLRPAKSATVAVFGPDGTPVAGARVAAARRIVQPDLVPRLFSDHPLGWSTQAETAADGRAVLEGLDPEASFVLGVRGPSSAGTSDGIEETWRPADTMVRLAAGLSGSGVARGAAGAFLCGAYVDCLEANGVSRTVVTGEDGTFRFTGLASGTLRLDARFEDSPEGHDPRSLRAEASVPAGAEGVDLRLR